MNNENREEKKEKKQVGLTTKILFGLLFGAITGFVLNYAVPDSYFKNTIVINGILQLIGALFSGLWQYGDWRYEKVRKRWCQSIRLLYLYNGIGCYGSFNNSKCDQSRNRS